MPRHKEPGAGPRGFARGKKRVLFVGCKWCDANPQHGITNAQHNLWDSLEATGCATCDNFFFDEYYCTHGKPGDRALVELCQRLKPDLVFLDWQQGSPHNPATNTLESIHFTMQLPIVAVWWDHVWDFHIQSAEKVSPYVNLHVVVDTGSFYPKVSNPQDYLFLWTPQDPRLYAAGRARRDIPISFMGRSAKVGGKEALAALAAANIGFYRDGGQREHQVTPEERARIFRRSRIVVNFSRSPSGYRQLVGQVTEVTLSGAMLLQEEDPETASLFEPGVDYVPWQGVDDLVEKAKYHITHERQRARIAAHGHRKARRYYSSEVFWRTVFDRLEEVSPQRQSAAQIATGRTFNRAPLVARAHPQSPAGKLRVYVYPDARPVNCDQNPVFENTVPFSRKGIAKWVEMTSPQDAEFFYMGQTTDKTMDSFTIDAFEYFKGNERRHIIDIEGDWFNRSIGEVYPYLKRSLLISRPADSSLRGTHVCVKPPFSYLLIEILKNGHEHFPLLSTRTFGFRGCIDRGLVRIKLYNALRLTDLKYEYLYSRQWFGRTAVTHPAVRSFEQFMTRHQFALCPRGTGCDSVRFYEACYYERVPIIIGDNILVGEDYYDTSFAFSISAELSEAGIAERLVKISEIPLSEAIERGREARAYFEDVIRVYYRDPMAFFISFLDRHSTRSVTAKRPVTSMNGHFV